MITITLDYNSDSIEIKTTKGLMNGATTAEFMSVRNMHQFQNILYEILNQLGDQDLGAIGVELIGIDEDHKTGIGEW